MCSKLASTSPYDFRVGHLHFLALVQMFILREWNTPSDLSSLVATEKSPFLSPDRIALRLLEKSITNQNRMEANSDWQLKSQKSNKPQAAG